MNIKHHKYKHLQHLSTDYLLIGAGVMSATLGTILRLTHPNASIMISERLKDCSLESSDALNNAGTGHAGYCELNYTPMDVDRRYVDVRKAIKVNNAFTKSLEFWWFLTQQGIIKSDFLHSVPHYSFVSGNEDVEYLKMRHLVMKAEENFKDIELITDVNDIKKQLPLIMEGRDPSIPVAVSKSNHGYDVDFGKLTRYLMDYLNKNGARVKYETEIIDLYKVSDKWNVIQRNLTTKELTRVETKFVFIGAGGAAITLLEKSGIPEGKHYGGFPVSGEWLICKNPEVVNKHKAKVYGKPSIGSPPMSVPHLDTRVINGETCLLFGPYAGMSTKFLKHGSNWDWFKSIRLYNIRTMISAGLRNMGLNKYLALELMKGKKARFNVLKSYYPNADKKDWKLLVAGQRVQIIKNVDGKGVIEFGTEIVSSEDGSLACLLGASPGASTSVKIMVDLMNQCFTLDDNVKNKIAEMVPSYNG
jgi:malate dehydrogenase (quinone)